MSKKVRLGPRPNRKKSMKIAGAGELDLPKCDEFNVWDDEFGWILKDGKPTIHTKAFWAKKRREFKQ
jgi:hypothetical protein